MDTAVTTLKFESKAVIPTDPRTKLFLTVTVSTIMITGGTGGFMNFVRPCLMACPIIFYFFQGSGWPQPDLQLHTLFCLRWN